MKFFLIAALSLSMANSVFANCSATSPEKCLDKVKCEELNSPQGGTKFAFQATTSGEKCMVVTAATASDCKVVVESARAANKPAIVTAPGTVVKPDSDGSTR